MAAAAANRPKLGSLIERPANVANTTKLTATVILIMFSTLIPFCVWYVYYGSVLQVFMIYKHFVIILLFEVRLGD
jgi:hypothetical protein